MRFRQHQTEAHARTRQLWLAFAGLVVMLTLTVNVLLALLYKTLLPFSFGYPNLFFETNTILILMFVLGGAWVEHVRLKSGGGQRVAHWLGARALQPSQSALERRLANVVAEMALASGQDVPQIYVMHRESSINGFVAGWGGDDTVLIVTRGALDRLNRAELQGLVAHEFGHIKENDLPLNMRTLSLVWGLSLVHGYGSSLMDKDEHGRINLLAWPIGFVLATTGWLGWLCGRILQATMSRQREYLADANAIQFTRSKDGIGNLLRKIWHDQIHVHGHLQHPAANMVAAMLLHDPNHHRLLACHPPLTDRIKRIWGTAMSPLAAPILKQPAHEQEPAPTPPSALAQSMTLAPKMAAAHADPFNAAANTLSDMSAPNEAQRRLQRLHGPKELRLLLLALMMDLQNPHEKRWWLAQAAGLVQGPQILNDVQALPATARIPEYERVADLLAQASIEHRRQVVQDARNLLRADGRISPRDRLWWLCLRHRLNQGTQHKPLLYPVQHHQTQLSDMSPTERQQVAAFTAYLARFVPLPERSEDVHPAAQVWYDQVMHRCGEDVHGAFMPTAPDADGLVHATLAVQEMNWMWRAMLVKAWVEEAFNHSPQGLLSHETADTLRLCAHLLDTPLPDMLAAHYRATH